MTLLYQVVIDRGKFHDCRPNSCREVYTDSMKLRSKAVNAAALQRTALQK